MKQLQNSDSTGRLFCIWILIINMAAMSSDYLPPFIAVLTHQGSFFRGYKHIFFNRLKDLGRFRIGKPIYLQLHLNQGFWRLKKTSKRRKTKKNIQKFSRLIALHRVLIPRNKNDNAFNVSEIITENACRTTKEHSCRINKKNCNRVKPVVQDPRAPRSYLFSDRQNM